MDRCVLRVGRAGVPSPNYPCHFFKIASSNEQYDDDRCSRHLRWRLPLDARRHRAFVAASRWAARPTCSCRRRCRGPASASRTLRPVGSYRRHRTADAWGALDKIAARRDSLPSPTSASWRALARRSVRAALPVRALLGHVQLPTGHDRWCRATSRALSRRAHVLCLRAPDLARPALFLDLGAVDDGAHWRLRRVRHVDDCEDRDRSRRAGIFPSPVRHQVVHLGDDVTDRDHARLRRG